MLEGNGFPEGSRDIQRKHDRPDLHQGCQQIGQNSQLALSFPKGKAFDFLIAKEDLIPFITELMDNMVTPFY